MPVRASRLTRKTLFYLSCASGTAAKPNWIIHTTASYLVDVSTTHHYMFDIKPDSVRDRGFLGR